jgi:hypothetical protein
MTHSTEVQPTDTEPGHPLISDDPYTNTEAIEPKRHPWAPMGILIIVLVVTLAVVIFAVVS